MNIAQALVSACRSGQEARLLDTHYANDCVSIEPADYSGNGRESRGLDAIRAKHAWWAENFEVHEATVEGPYLHGDDRFAVVFAVDSTHRTSGERSAAREAAVYHVSNGKISREEFFYSV